MLADSHTKGASPSIRFTSRNIKFKSAAHEVDFYKEAHGFGAGADGQVPFYSFMNEMMSHNNNLIKKAMLYQTFGANPKKTFRAFTRKVRMQDGIALDEAKRIDKAEANFDRLYDAYTGHINVDNVTLENVSSGLNMLTSATMSAPGASVRNAIFDFAFNKAAIQQLSLIHI